jgi:hypothetical protein
MVADFSFFSYIYLQYFHLIFQMFLSLQIKEVAAPYTSGPDLRRFWEHDIRVARDNNRATMSHGHDKCGTADVEYVYYLLNVVQLNQFG